MSLLNELMRYQQMRRQRQQEDAQYSANPPPAPSPSSLPAPTQGGSLLNTSADPDPDPGGGAVLSSAASGMGNKMALAGAIGSLGSSLGTMLGSHPAQVAIPTPPPAPKTPEFVPPQMSRSVNG
jgi:hypothetical protein